MSLFQVTAEIPEGDVGDTVDLNAFQSEVEEHLGELKSRLRQGELTRSSVPPPEGAAGIEVVIQWIIEHHEELSTLIVMLESVIPALSAAARRYFLRRKKKNRGPTVRVRAGDCEVELPTTQRRLKSFLECVDKGALVLLHFPWTDWRAWRPGFPGP